MSRTIRKARRRARHKKTLCQSQSCGWCEGNRFKKHDTIRGTISEEFLINRRRPRDE